LAPGWLDREVQRPLGKFIGLARLAYSPSVPTPFHDELSVKRGGDDDLVAGSYCLLLGLTDSDSNSSSSLVRKQSGTNISTEDVKPRPLLIPTHSVFDLVGLDMVFQISSQKWL
jgi:hypothetical protein